MLSLSAFSTEQMDLTVLDELVEEYMLQEELTDKAGPAYDSMACYSTFGDVLSACRAHLQLQAIHSTSDEPASRYANWSRQETCVQLWKLFHSSVRKP